MKKMEKTYYTMESETELQRKISQMIKDAEARGKVGIEIKLIVIAKNSGYEFTIEEMKELKADQGRLRSTT